MNEKMLFTPDKISICKASDCKHIQFRYCCRLNCKNYKVWGVIFVKSESHGNKKKCPIH